MDAPAYRLGAAQSVASAVASAQSAAFAAGTKAIRIVGTEDCYILIGSNPTASSSGHFIQADTVYEIGVSGGEKLAAIRHLTTDGTVYISEMSY